MNYRAGDSYSIILMSVRKDAPYRDRFQGDGSTLIYEGHDIPRGSGSPNPKLVDQQEQTSKGTLTENGKFHKAAQDYKQKQASPARVKVYEKIRGGIWSYNGVFHLVDSYQEHDGVRQVFKFILEAVMEHSSQEDTPTTVIGARRRIIPTSVKLEVWQRDNGKCVVCGAHDELHFDHIIPFSRGGTSLKADNVQLLCARHNLGKSDNIE
jgi:hypothetical protein